MGFAERSPTSRVVGGGPAQPGPPWCRRLRQQGSACGATIFPRPEGRGCPRFVPRHGAGQALKSCPDAKARGWSARHPNRAKGGRGWGVEYLFGDEVRDDCHGRIKSGLFDQLAPCGALILRPRPFSAESPGWCGSWVAFYFPLLHG